MVNGVIKEITNYDELKESLEIIIKTYKDRDEKMNLSNENNHRHSNMTYEELKERFDNADLIIWLDYSTPMLVKGVLKRFIKSSLLPKKYSLIRILSYLLLFSIYSIIIESVINVLVSFNFI